MLRVFFPNVQPGNETAAWIFLIFIAAIGLATVILMPWGLYVVTRDTLRRSGKWGINLRPRFCPRCGKAAPTYRVPKNRQQAAWGGYTCEWGCEVDKWGCEAPPSAVTASAKRGRRGSPSGSQRDFSSEPRNRAKLLRPDGILSQFCYAWRYAIDSE